MSNQKKLIFVIAFGIVVLIFSMIYDLIEAGIDLTKLNNLYKDIEILEDRISIYYLNNGNIPIKGKIEFNHSINPNDNENFYELDLDKLENLFINYGKKNYGNNDIYIINEQSHTIYYMKGITYNKEVFYSRKLAYEKIDLEEYK